MRARSRIGDRAAASEAALEATRNAVSAWQRTGRQLNCGDILGMRKWSLVQFMLKGNLRVCQGQLCDMAPVFHDIIEKTMSERGQFTAGARRRNCAAEAFDRVSEAIGLKTDGLGVVVAGLAGGLGLSGNACGALAAAILAISLQYFKERDKPKHSMMRSNLQGFLVGIGWMNPSREAARLFRSRFHTKLCSEITGRRFAGSEDLATYLDAGRCDSVLEAVAADAAKALAQ